MFPVYSARGTTALASLTVSSEHATGTGGEGPLGALCAAPVLAGAEVAVTTALRDMGAASPQPAPTRTASAAAVRIQACRSSGVTRRGQPCPFLLHLSGYL